MRELSVQASTDTLNDVNRASINLKYQALKNEIARIANVTQYNEMDILNSSNAHSVIDAGAAASGAEEIELNQASTGSYRFESKDAGQLTLTNTNTGQQQTVSIPAANSEGIIELNYADFGIKVKLNNQFDANLVVGQELVDSAQS